MRRVYYGSDFQSKGAKAKDGILHTDSTGTVLGIRLVHDDVVQVFRGGSPLYGGHVARVADRGLYQPDQSKKAFGIRLCADVYWEEE